ncbi:MAG TPA: MoxR family ATPase [Gammaproteobacteria bacterium]|nr:MoxR family ATPase [Gammaproteobacteria bacterium]
MGYSKVAISKNLESSRDTKALSKLNKAIQQHIIGQKNLIESLLIGVLCDGHVLLESMPGLAKTTAAKALAQGIDGKFHRIQFTPDLLPSDVIGTDVFNQATQEFSFKKGPVFQNIVLADEINRAPAKVQSALLEAMEEKQVTVGQASYALPELFMVVATQNPIEQEGTYNLPEAQLDRFLLHVVLDYPNHAEELDIINLDQTPVAVEKTSQAEVLEARKIIKNIYVDDKLKNYIISVVQATRNPGLYSEELATWISHGASPRASKAALHCAQAYAWLYGEEYVLPEHIQAMWHNILRHRIALSFEAQADGITKDNVIDALLRVVAIP